MLTGPMSHKAGGMSSFVHVMLAHCPEFHTVLAIGLVAYILALTSVAERVETKRDMPSISSNHEVQPCYCYTWSHLKPQTSYASNIEKLVLERQ